MKISLKLESTPQEGFPFDTCDIHMTKEFLDRIHRARKAHEGFNESMAIMLSAYSLNGSIDIYYCFVNSTSIWFTVGVYNFEGVDTESISFEKLKDAIIVHLCSSEETCEEGYALIDREPHRVAYIEAKNLTYAEYVEELRDE